MIPVTVQTGLLTAIWAVVDLTVYLTVATGVHLIFNFPLSKLYTNSLMSTLNSRAGWTDDSDSKDLQSFGGDGTVDGLNKNPRQTRLANVVQLGTTQSTDSRPEVFVHVESHEMVDSPSSKFPTSDSTEFDDSRKWPMRGGKEDV